MIGSKVAIDKINKVNVLTERVKKRRQEYWEMTPHLCAERGRQATLSWKESEGKPTVIRRGKLFEKVLGGIPVAIWDGELIVGSQTRFVRGCYTPLEINPQIGLAECESETPTIGSEVVGIIIPEEDRKAIIEDAHWWKGKSVCDRMDEIYQQIFGSWAEDAVKARLIPAIQREGMTASDVNYEKVLNIGLKGVIEEAREEIRGLSVFDFDEVHKLHFLQAVIIACEALITYAKRYAQLARELASEEKDSIRRGELEAIAKICEWVPENPARNFREALQSFWFCFLALVLEEAGFTQSPARMDQYFFPFYEKDIREGTLTHQDAAEILGCLWVKFLELSTHKGPQQKERTQGSQYSNLTVGGITREGEDATNELSHLILEVVRQVKVHQPHLCLRYHDKMSEDFLVKAIECNRDAHGGIPYFNNDRVVIHNLLDKGIPPEEAWDWAGFGCVHPNLPHRVGQPTSWCHVNINKVFELTLHNGVDPVSGKKLGIETGDVTSFSAYEELYDAFKEQFGFWLKRGAQMARISSAAYADMYPVPFHSATLDDCLKNGRDANESGGMRYPQMAAKALDRGHQNVANSFAAIKKLVFDEKKITMAELIGALANNFEGKEELHQMLLRAPKWGNDDNEADDIMKDLWSWTAEAVTGETNAWGYHIGTARHGLSWHYWAGKATGALPDGRKAFTPLAPGALDPMTGTSTEGPTGLINSCSKLTFDRYGLMDAVLNQKLSPSILQTREQIKKVLALVRNYFDRGGLFIQFNVIDKDALLAAQKQPEKFRDLVVRVAGYSAYFVELPRELQDEIIDRTEYTF
jgi:formate C-acetyltransferase